MTLSDAANMVTIQQGQDQILRDPSLSIWGKAQALTALQNAAAAQPESHGWLSADDIARGAVGAGIGYGVGTIMGRMLSASPSTLKTVQRLGLGLGTLINTGAIMNKNSADNELQARHDAFRLGFVKAALDLGLIKSSGVVGTVPLTEIIKAPIDLGTNLAGSLSTMGGGLAGHIMGDDDSDVELTQMGMQQRQLESKAKDLESTRRMAAIKRVLDKRLGRR